MKSGRTLVDLARELARQTGSKKDLLVPLPQCRHHTREDGACVVTVAGPQGPEPYAVTPLARRQLAEKLKIPHAYFERMRHEAPALLDHNVNAWMARDAGERQLLRTLDGQARAFLSERYRRLDHYDLVEHVLPALQELPEVHFESVELTETRLYLKAVTPRVTAEVRPGDVVQAGVVITNSEVGCGSLSVQPLVFRLACRNGLVLSDRTLRKTHVGRALDAELASGQVYKDDTLQAEDRAFFLKVRDMVAAAVTAATLEPAAARLRALAGLPLGGDPVKTVEVLAQRHGLNDEERGGILHDLVAGTDLTGYGLVNAITGYSQRVADYDRASELEALGGRLLETPAAQWASLATA